MNTLRSHKRLLVAEATVHRQLLHAETAHLVAQAKGWKQDLVSVRTMVQAGLGLGRILGMLRGKAPSKSRLGTLIDLARTGWSLWAAWPSPDRTPVSGTRRPAPESDRALAEATSALRNAALEQERRAALR